MSLLFNTPASSHNTQHFITTTVDTFHNNKWRSVNGKVVHMTLILWIKTSKIQYIILWQHYEIKLFHSLILCDIQHTCSHFPTEHNRGMTKTTTRHCLLLRQISRWNSPEKKNKKNIPSAHSFSMSEPHKLWMMLSILLRYDIIILVHKFSWLHAFSFSLFFCLPSFIRSTFCVVASGERWRCQ